MWVWPGSPGDHRSAHPCHGPGRARRPGRGGLADATAPCSARAPCPPALHSAYRVALPRPCSSHRSRLAEMEGSSWQNRQEKRRGPSDPDGGRGQCPWGQDCQQPEGETRVKAAGLREGLGQGSAGTPTALAEGLPATSSRRPASRTARCSAMACTCAAPATERGAVRRGPPPGCPAGLGDGYLALQDAPTVSSQGESAGPGVSGRVPLLPGLRTKVWVRPAACHCTAHPGRDRGPCCSSPRHVPRGAPSRGPEGPWPAVRVWALDGLVPSSGSFSCPPATSWQDCAEGGG